MNPIYTTFNKKNKQRGYILIESILSISLISVVLMSVLLLFYFTFNVYQSQTELLDEKHDAEIVLKYIEKRLKELNQESIVYDDKKYLFKGKDINNQMAQIDLSGRLSTKYNTLLTFYQFKNEIRINKKGENNVLSNNIKDVIITELVEGKLIEIEVITNKLNYSSNMKLNIEYSEN